MLLAGPSPHAAALVAPDAAEHLVPAARPRVTRLEKDAAVAQARAADLLRTAERAANPRIRRLLFAEALDETRRSRQLWRAATAARDRSDRGDHSDRSDGSDRSVSTASRLHLRRARAWRRLLAVALQLLPSLASLVALAAACFTRRRPVEGHAAVARFLAECGAPFRAFGEADDLHAEMARRLAGGETCAWLTGPESAGAPFARAILADPRSSRHRDRARRRYGSRIHDPRRDRDRRRDRLHPPELTPFSAAVLTDEASLWFEVPPDEDSPVLSRARGAAAASAGAEVLPCEARVTPQGHRTLAAVEDTVIVHRLPRRPHPLHGGSRAFRSLVESFRTETGVGVLAYAPLALAGEPPSQSPAEAYALFLRSDLDFLVLERCLVEKRPF